MQKDSSCGPSSQEKALGKLQTGDGFGIRVSPQLDELCLKTLRFYSPPFWALLLSDQLMKRLAARRYAGLLILSPTAAADPDKQPADRSQVNILLHVFLLRFRTRLSFSAWEERKRWIERKRGCLCVCERECV